jgi:hypothetical protein
MSFSVCTYAAIYEFPVGRQVLTAVVMISSFIRDIMLWNCWKSTDILGEHVTSIFRAKEWAKRETSLKEVATRAMSLPKFQFMWEMLDNKPVLFNVVLCQPHPYFPPPPFFLDHTSRTIFRVMLVILVTSPVCSHHVYGRSQWELASCSCTLICSVCPMGEPTGTDLMSCFSFLFPI